MDFSGQLVSYQINLTVIFFLIFRCRFLAQKGRTLKKWNYPSFLPSLKILLLRGHFAITISSDKIDLWFWIELHSIDSQIEYHLDKARISYAAAAASVFYPPLSLLKNGSIRHQKSNKGIDYQEMPQLLWENTWSNTWSRLQPAGFSNWLITFYAKSVASVKKRSGKCWSVVF